MSWKRIFIVMLVLSILTILVRLIEDLPWWAFVFPCAIVGSMIHQMNWKIPHIFTGFITGFILWPLLNIFFHFKYDGLLLSKVGLFYGFIGLMVSGFLTGLLMALTISIGYSITKIILDGE